MSGSCVTCQPSCRGGWNLLACKTSRVAQHERLSSKAMKTLSTLLCYGKTRLDQTLYLKAVLSMLTIYLLPVQCEITAPAGLHPTVMPRQRTPIVVCRQGRDGGVLRTMVRAL